MRVNPAVAKKYTNFASGVFVALAMTASGLASAVEVSIPDAALEEALRDATEIPTDPLLDSDLASLTSLSASSLGIADLTGLEYCTDLDELDLSDNQISDLTPLSGLSDLDELDLSDNQISDLTPLSGLSDLDELDLSDNQISDLAPLSGLSDLDELDLSDNQISDLAPLAGLSDLKVLFLDGNRICDLGALVANTGLNDDDSVSVGSNPLLVSACTEDIPALEARGVSVSSDSACDDGGVETCPVYLDVVYVAPGGNGAGTEEAPFGTIQSAVDLAGELASEDVPVTIVVAAGNYEEVVNFHPGVRLVGAGMGQTRVTPTLAQLANANVVITGADGAGIEGLSIVLPIGAPPVAAVSVHDSSFTMLDVEVDGNGVAASVGIRVGGAGVKGTDAAPSLVKDCLVHDVSLALEINDAGAKVAFNKFENIFGAVTVRVLDSPGSLPLLGNSADLVNSGSNTFSNISSLYVQNDKSTITYAQSNYWDNLSVEEQILARVNGEVDVSQPLFTIDAGKQSILPATLSVILRDAATNNPVSDGRVTLVPVEGDLPESAEPGVYVLPLMPKGHYTVRASLAMWSK